jgi:hypothetical protein
MRGDRAVARHARYRVDPLAVELISTEGTVALWWKSETLL